MIEDAHITSVGLAMVRELPTLRSLTLEGSLAGHELGDDALDAIIGTRTLTDLYLTGRGFTDAGLAVLASKSKISYVSLRDSSVTPTGLAAAKLLRPGMRVFIPQQR